MTAAMKAVGTAGLMADTMAVGSVEKLAQSLVDSLVGRSAARSVSEMADVRVGLWADCWVGRSGATLAEQLAA